MPGTGPGMTNFALIAAITSSGIALQQRQMGLPVQQFDL
jgi:hypothetical protein